MIAMVIEALVILSHLVLIWLFIVLGKEEAAKCGVYLNEQEIQRKIY